MRSPNQIEREGITIWIQPCPGEPIPSNVRKCFKQEAFSFFFCQIYKKVFKNSRLSEWSDHFEKVHNYISLINFVPYWFLEKMKYIFKCSYDRMKFLNRHTYLFVDWYWKRFDITLIFSIIKLHFIKNVFFEQYLRIEYSYY